jgi:general secretion pathway protein M
MSALSNIRAGIARVVRRPVARFNQEWDRMAPRERRWAAGLAVVVAVVAVGLGFGNAISDIGDLQSSNGAIREALGEIAKHRDEYLEAKSRNAVLEARIGNDPPQLTGDLEAAARAENVAIAESSERPTVPAGRRYLQHDVDLKVREVDLQSLTKFLRRVETGPRLVYFTRLSLKHRYSTESDKLDVELTATAFEKVHEDKTKKKPEPAGKKE